MPGWVVSAFEQPAFAAFLPAIAVTVWPLTVKLYCAPCRAELALHLQTLIVALEGELTIVACVSAFATTATLSLPVRSFSETQLPEGTTEEPDMTQRPLERSSCRV